MALIAPLLSTAPAAAEPLRILAFGDSLTAGLGVRPEEAFPAVLEKRLRKDGFDVSVENAGVSGNTTAQALARYPSALASRPDLIILELGANDMLNRIDPAVTQANLEKLIRRGRARGADVLLAGMVDIDSADPERQRRFDAIFPRLAAQYRLPLYPMFLDGVGANKELTQPGGLHPTAEGVVKIVERIATLVEAMLTTRMATPKER